MREQHRTYLVTGVAGFIGFHLSNLLLSKGYSVVGVDSLTDYYDVTLKRSRLEILHSFARFTFFKEDIANDDFPKTLSSVNFDVVIHLAAQAGVRYSIERPREYLDSNIVGTFNLLELSVSRGVEHLLCASTSSVYGSNNNMPFGESQKCDTPMSFYAATKKANEVMAHSYSHIHGLPTTMFRFFTVYGPWGRPDMALFKFTRAIKENRPIDVYNHGAMQRDFTFVGDLVEAIYLLSYKKPCLAEPIAEVDSMSDVAPFRVVNIGNAQPVELMAYIEEIELALGLEAKKNFMPMQQGDVPATFANTSLLKALTGFQPSTSVEDGIRSFVSWYLQYYKTK